MSNKSALITTDEYEQSKNKFKMKNNKTKNKKQKLYEKNKMEPS